VVDFATDLLPFRRERLVGLGVGLVFIRSPHHRPIVLRVYCLLGFTLVVFEGGSDFSLL
jgi:hypothetical protein